MSNVYGEIRAERGHAIARWSRKKIAGKVQTHRTLITYKLNADGSGSIVVMQNGATRLAAEIPPEQNDYASAVPKAVESR